MDDRIRESARRVLPFRLTGGQKTALERDRDDMQRPQPMNRLLQGDVGAGKTIVALLARLVAMENGLQVAFMAPTEILAEQHYINIRRLLERVALSRRAADGQRRRRRGGARSSPSSRAARCIWSSARTRSCRGTSRSTTLGLVVIDEQHRFGVLQRATLRAKGLHPDVLVMTATPIPRTLALTVYGDLDVSVDSRAAARTAADHDDWRKPESRRDEVYRLVRQQLDAGRQAYVIYPLVEESEKVDLQAATEMADHLRRRCFPDYASRCCTGG